MHSLTLHTECRWLLALMRRAVCGGGQVPDAPVDWDALLKLARRHRVETLLFRGLDGVANVPNEVWERLQNSWRRALMQDARQEYAARVIAEALTAHDIPYAPAKGLVLKEHYPSRELRYMSDLDFYIRAEDRERIHAVMESLGAVVANTDSGDVNYEMPGHVLVEFHGLLLYRVGIGGVENYADWTCVIPGENRLTEEAYALNLIGHVIYNMAGAGCGARFVLDIWVYRHRCPNQPDWNSVFARLAADGLEQVARNLLDLSEYWFGAGVGSELLDEMGAYILDSGLYGVGQRATLSVAGFQGGKLGAIKMQLFRSRGEFENRYPWLKKYPYLLPAAWVIRGITSLRTNRDAMHRWTKQLNQDDQEAVRQQMNRLQRFGFQLRENKKPR